MVNRALGILCWSLSCLSTMVLAGNDISSDYPYLKKLYLHLHQNPELSFKEVKTGKKIADEMKALGFEVTREFGGHGVVAVLKNGAGPTVLIRTDLDGLPVQEQTGLPYASKVIGQDLDGEEKPVMHACGHDIHMTTFVGTAKNLIRHKARWKGTLVMIGQPAEERGGGAKAMLEAGLFEKFPRPDFNLALHVAASLPAGKVAYVSGAALANVDSVDITIYGIGGHGAYPHKSKDPIVLSAQIINALQTIVSREISPLEPAVITVGSIHGGSKHNIIPDQVQLQLTLRSYSMDVRDQMLVAIKRMVQGVAMAAGIPEERLPLVSLGNEFTPVTYNDPQLVQRLLPSLIEKFGKENVIETAPVMGGEDFGRYALVEPKIPSFIFWLGAVDPEKYLEYTKTGKELPSLHSPFFAPEPSLSISTGVAAMTAAALELLD